MSAIGATGKFYARDTRTGEALWSYDVGNGVIAPPVTYQIGGKQYVALMVGWGGSDAAARRIERVLWNDPASGVMRHADAGYDIAVDCGHHHGLDLPGLKR